MNRTKIVWVLPVVFFCSVAWADLPEYATCGTDMKMTIDERSADCSSKNESALAGAKMKLVMADEKGHEIKLDAFGLLWGDRVEENLTFDEAKKTCAGVTESDGYPTIQGNDGKPLVWIQPEAEDFARIGQPDQELFNKNRENASEEEDISGNGSWEELSNAGSWYWSSSPFDSYDGWFFLGGGGDVDYGYRNGEGSVRCVARR